MRSHSVVKLHETTQMFRMVDYVREMTVKKSCKYGEYGSFEHLIFVFVFCFWSFWGLRSTDEEPDIDVRSLNDFSEQDGKKKKTGTRGDELVRRCVDLWEIS